MVLAKKPSHATVPQAKKPSHATLPLLGWKGLVPLIEIVEKSNLRDIYGHK